MKQRAQSFARSRALSFVVLVSFLWSAACAVHPPPGDIDPLTSPLPRATAFVVAGQQILAIGPGQSEPVLVLDSPLLQDVQALTRQPVTGDLFALTRGTDDPHLVVISNQDRSARDIGPIDLPKVSLQVADGLAFDDTDGSLYVTAGIGRLADLLLEVDPETAETRRISRITGTPQRELDALVFVHGKAFGLDTALETSTLVRLDRATGRATPMGKPFEAQIQDLAWDSAQARFLVVSGDQISALTLGAELIALSPNRAEGTAAPPWTAVASVPDAGTIFVDGFESGDSSLWSSQRVNP